VLKKAKSILAADEHGSTRIEKTRFYLGSSAFIGGSKCFRRAF
jgi:hypothetical protein